MPAAGVFQITARADTAHAGHLADPTLIRVIHSSAARHLPDQATRTVIDACHSVYLFPHKGTR